MLSEAIKELQKEWGLTEPLEQKVPGIYEVPLDEELFFTMSEEDGAGITLFCQVAPVIKGQEEKLFTKALNGNLFGQGTKGSLLGLSESGSILTLSRVIDYHVELKELKEIVEDFISTIDFWREEVFVNK